MIATSLLLINLAASSAPGPSAPDLLLSESRLLVEVRERIRHGDPTLSDALRRLRIEADEVLTRAPCSVVDKKPLPAGADPHDYRSLAPYWWPDPAKADGLPWIRRDGERNPQTSTEAYDARRWGEVRAGVGRLALAYFLTGHEPYAQHAGRLLRVWFLDPATRMNPHLKYAQAIPGLNTGRGIGIIETARVPELLDRVELLVGSPAWTTDDRRRLREWMAAYLEWLLTSGPGQEEGRATNSHGSWYDVQVVALALRTGRPEAARQQLARTRDRIAAQIEPDGRQPRELQRTRALGYSVFNLEALLTVAFMADRLGVDLWRHATADGRSLSRALDFLLPFADPSRKWPHAQITPAPWGNFDRILRIAFARTGDRRYAEAHAHLPEPARGEPDNILLHPVFESASATSR